MAFMHSRDDDTDRAGKVQITAKIIRESEKAIRVDDGVKQFWLPRRGVTVTRIGKGAFVEILMSPRLARQKGCW